MEVGGQSHAPATLPPGKIEEAGTRARLDGCGKFILSPGFDPRAVQPVASRYTYRVSQPKHRIWRKCWLFCTLCLSSMALPMTNQAKINTSRWIFNIIPRVLRSLQAAPALQLLRTKPIFLVSPRHSTFAPSHSPWCGRFADSLFWKCGYRKNVTAHCTWPQHIRLSL